MWEKIFIFQIMYIKSKETLKTRKKYEDKIGYSILVLIKKDFMIKYFHFPSNFFLFSFPIRIELQPFETEFETVWLMEFSGYSLNCSGSKKTFVRAHKKRSSEIHIQCDR